MAEAKRKTDSPIVVMGVKVSIVQDDLDDEDIMDALVAINAGDGSDDPAKVSAAQAARHELCELMFGGDWQRIRAELKEKMGEEHNGRKRLRASTVSDFINGVFEAVNRKNS